MLHRRLRIIGAILALLVLVVMSPSACYAETTVSELKQHEQRVLKVVRKVLPCTVCLQGAGGSGSGIIVSEDGLVLTAAHVTRGVDKDFVVIFPDGRKVQGKSLGLNTGRDGAMLQIVDKGKYPFVEIGSSSSLKRGDWCFMLGHARGFDEDRTPPVRIGRVYGVRTFVRTNCVLASGDSGGPLFDLDGRLIGIHSNSGHLLSQNNHVPIDVFRNDWDRMKQGEKWGGRQKGPGHGGKGGGKRPALGVQLDPMEVKGGIGVQKVLAGSPAASAGLRAEDVIVQFGEKSVKKPTDVEQLIAKRKAGAKVELKVRRGDEELTLEVKLVRASSLSSLDDPSADKTDTLETGDLAKQQMTAFKSAVAVASRSTYKLTLGNKHVALATAVTDHTLVTKASEIGDKPFQIEIDENLKVVGTVVKRFDEYDLALIRVADGDSNSVSFRPVNFAAVDTPIPLGTFVAAVGPTEDPAAVGVLSVQSRHVKMPNDVFLGVAFEEAEGGIQITQIAPRSPAKQAGLKPRDLVLTVDKKPCPKPEVLADAVAAHKSGDEIDLLVRRGQLEISVQAKLRDRSAGRRGNKKLRGYRTALQHDCPLRLVDCGGPLVNLDGQVIGINIGSPRRYKAYAIPADIIRSLLSGKSSERGDLQTVE